MFEANGAADWSEREKNGWLKSTENDARWKKTNVKHIHTLYGHKQDKVVTEFSCAD